MLEDFLKQGSPGFCVPGRDINSKCPVVLHTLFFFFSSLMVKCFLPGLNVIETKEKVISYEQ